MSETAAPARVTGGDVSFRLPDGKEPVLTVTFADNRHGMRSLTLTREESEALAQYTEGDSWRLGPEINRDEVQFGVVFERGEIPEYRQHDRTAIFDYGHGELHVSLPNGRTIQLDICPLLAKHIDAATE